MNPPKIAFVHDWLVDKGGAENVLSSMLELFPKAPVYTLVYDSDGQCHDFLGEHQVITSFLQKVPQATKRYRSFLAFMPLAIEQFDLSDYDLIISSSHAVAKGVITGPDQLHICYIHSPIRYAWDFQHQYLHETGLERGLKGWLVKICLHYIRNWDVRTSNGVDHFIANSRFISRRVWKVYRRQSKVIHPPVDIETFTPHTEKKDYYLTISRMVPYKKMDLIVSAFSEMPQKQLIVIGDGPDREKLEKLASNNISFLGYQPIEILKDHLQHAKAFVFAAKEDFGILPVEAQACGTPVIAYGKGGVLETVIDGRTGLFYYEQTVTSLVDAILRFESSVNGFSVDTICENADKFCKVRFQREFKEFVMQKWDDFQSSLRDNVTVDY